MGCEINRKILGTYLHTTIKPHKDKKGFQCFVCVKYFTMFDGEAPMITSKHNPWFSYTQDISRLHQQI